MLAVSTQASDGLYRSPLEVLTSGWRNRTLILRLARREIVARYRASMLGLAWSVIVPLMMLGVFTFLFAVVFPAKWPDLPVKGTGQFAMVFFAGLIVFNLFAECINRAPQLMVENVSYIKKVVFPLECLPWVALAVATFNALVSVAALLIGFVLLVGIPPWTTLLWPLVLIPLLLATAGLTWFLSSLGVYVRDIHQFVPVLTTVLLYATPIFYPADMLKGRVPAPLLAILQANPLAAAVEQTRGLLFRSELPHWGLLLLHLLLAWLIAWLGYMWFCKTRKGFADVT